MEMSEIQAARLLLGGDGRAGQAASRQVGQESASVRYGEVKSVGAEAGTVTVLLDGQSQEITLTDATASTRLKVGDRVKVGSKSGLDKNVPDDEIRFGYPALPGMQYHRSAAVFKRLPELAQQVRALEKQLAELTKK